MDPVNIRPYQCNGFLCKIGQPLAVAVIRYKAVFLSVFDLGQGRLARPYAGPLNRGIQAAVEIHIYRFGCSALIMVIYRDHSLLEVDAVIDGDRIEAFFAGHRFIYVIPVAVVIPCEIPPEGHKDLLIIGFVIIEFIFVFIAFDIIFGICVSPLLHHGQNAVIGELVLLVVAYDQGQGRCGQGLSAAKGLGEFRGQLKFQLI
ncbi:MAG: hypothetical protein BWY65_02395 [Firmicutes bacterium ADurb.Bin373]|nr:MAG: hypothetical protein BWY65_02395 [Firmicutes bacterium ADurb.Bin373]